MKFEKPVMDHQHWFAQILFILLLSHVTRKVIADMNSDKQALLDFAPADPHVRKLNWSSNSPVCSSWFGIKCNPSLTRVVALQLPGVGLLSSIPADTIGKLDALQILSLRCNGINEDLPPDVSSPPSLHFLFIQNNNLTCDFPAFSSSGLNVLDMSHNSFSGEIPLAIQSLTQLTVLYLQSNSLSGTIPDLKFPDLKHLNLSNNNLRGPIPILLRHFPKDPFLGNLLLCGFPLSLCSGLPPSPSPLPFTPPPALPLERKKIFWKRLSRGVIIAIAASGATLLLLLAIVILLCCLKRRGGESDGEPKGKGSVGGNFDLADLLRASAEILGKGSYGATYKAVLKDDTTVVVKRLREVVVGKREFEQQMEMIRRVGQHQNVLPLRAYYYSKDEKLLVYD